MNFTNRRRGIFEYLRKRIARRFLRNISREHIQKKDQLVVFSFDFISQFIAIDGRFENHELSLIEKIFKGKLDSKISLDIGSNIGNHTVALSKFSKMVYAFEPNPYVFDVLKLNIQNLKNVRGFNFGVSNFNQDIIAKVPLLNCGGGSTSLDAKNTKANHFYETLFKLKALDQFRLLSNKDIGLIKIDVEGHELQALKGMKILLKKNKPVILFEQNRGILRQTSAEVEFMKSIGYKFLYEFVEVERWITTKNMPKTFESIFRFLEVVIFGEPSGELKLKQIQALDKKSYDMLIFSFQPLER
jgi:FkbM family methyltransferase